jgi:hypothetical protein
MHYGSITDFTGFITHLVSEQLTQVGDKVKPNNLRNCAAK